MSSVYKVMQQMQQTQPRRVRGNRPVMVVLGAIVIVGMLMMLGAINRPLVVKGDGQALAEPTHHPDIHVAEAEVDWNSEWNPRLGDFEIITVTLNPQNQWVIADHGVVTDEEIRAYLMEKRALATERGASAIVRARIAGDESAKHFIRLHHMAVECEMDQINMVASDPTSPGS